jgi:hypothetical protein
MTQSSRQHPGGHVERQRVEKWWSVELVIVLASSCPWRMALAMATATGRARANGHVHVVAEVVGSLLARGGSKGSTELAGRRRARACLDACRARSGVAWRVWARQSTASSRTCRCPLGSGLCPA